MISAEGLCKSYFDPSGEERKILVDLAANVVEGETVAIVGPSGSGKSTFLNLLGALDIPDNGTLTVNGQCMTELGDKGRIAFRCTSIGFVFQHHHLLPQCTVLENVLLPALAFGGRAVPPNAQDRGMRLLERVGLVDRSEAFPTELSGGERQRVAVVRALVNRPAVLLADEPTGALDVGNAGRLIDLLLELNAEEKTTLVVVTHSEEAATRMGRTLQLREGALQELGEGTADS